MKKLMIACAILVSSTVLMAGSQELRNVITTRGHAEREVAPNVIEVSVKLSEMTSRGKVTLGELEANFFLSLKDANVNTKTAVKIVAQSSEAHKKTDAFQYKSFVVTLKSADELNALFAGFDKYNVQNAKVIKVWNDNYENIVQELQLEAVKDAKNDAARIAGAIDQQIGKAIIIDQGYAPRPNFGEMSYAKSAMMVSDSAISGNVELKAPNQMANITVYQSISVTFELN